MPDKRIVALYIRVAHKSDDAVAMQESMLRKYADSCGYQDISVYVDNGVSGIGYNRPALRQLHSDIIAGHISKVIVKDISRVSRSFFEIPNWINGIRRYGVSFISVMDDMTDETFVNKDELFRLFLECPLNELPHT